METKQVESLQGFWLSCGRVVLGLSVAFAIILKTGLYGGLPLGAASWVLILLGAGYLAYTLAPGRISSGLLGVSCILSGAYFSGWKAPISVAGLILAACGILLLATEFRLSEGKEGS